MHVIILLYVILGQLTPCDLKTVRTEVWEARLKWCDIGIELKLNKNDLDIIQTEITKCFNEMLCEWLNRVDLQPSWNSLVNALCAPAVGLGHLAEKIKQKHVLAHSNRESTTAIGNDNVSQCIEKRPNSNCQVSVNSVVAGFSFAHINEVSTLDEGQKKALEQCLRDESQQIMLQFCTLLDKFFDSLEDSTMTPKRLIRYLKKLLRVLDPDGDMYELDSAASIDDIQILLKITLLSLIFVSLNIWLEQKRIRKILKNIGITLSAMQNVEFMKALQTLGLLSHLIMKRLS